MSDVRAREFILFGLKCSRSPQQLTRADFDSLRAHGIGDAESVEAIAMAGVAVYANIMADATAVEPDGMFEGVGRAAT